MRDLSFKKVRTVAVREFRSTALTKAFLFGAVIFPMAIWGIMALVSMFKFDKPPMEGTLVVADRTAQQVILPALNDWFDAAKAKARALEDEKKLDEAMKAAKEKMPAGVTDAQLESAKKMAQAWTGFGIPPIVKVEALPADADMEEQRQRAMKNEVLAVVRITDDSLQARVPEASDDKGSKKSTGVNAAPVAGTYEFIQGDKLRPDHAEQIRSAVNTAIQDQRYRMAGMDPNKVRQLQMTSPAALTKVATKEGTKEANEGLTRMLPFIFMMLIYVATVTGGQYLMMGTLEEKGSRVMEVILSAASPKEILIGKLIGQGLVGLAVLAIYAIVGMGVAKKFGAFQSIPMNVLPWAVVYFIMAYAFLGSLMLAVGSAVTEIREAQALYTPITISIILPFMLIMPILQNPSSLVARLFSFFPPTTPYVMVMRLSQTSNPIPLWELIATAVVGFIGVGVVVWAAAKIFRVGVLMYGKPPNLMGLLKWIRYA